MDLLKLKLLDNIKTVTDKEEEWNTVKKMIVLEINYQRYFEDLVKSNQLFTYVGSLLDIELPMVLGFRNIRMIDPHYSEKNVFEEYVIPRIQIYGSIVKDTTVSKTERVMEVCLENGEMCTFHFLGMIIDYGSQHVKVLQETYDCQVGEVTWKSGVLCSYMFSDSHWILQALDMVPKEGYILTTDSPQKFRDSLPLRLKSLYELIQYSQSFWKGQSFEQKVLSVNLIKGNVFLCKKI